MSLNKAGIQSRIAQFAAFGVKVLSSRWFLIGTIAWFVFQAIYIAVSTRFGLPPDEKYHFLYIELFAENSFSPFLSTQKEQYFMGDVIRDNSYLYHYIYGYVYRFGDLLFESRDALKLVLRLANILPAVGTLVAMHAIARHLKVNKMLANIAVFSLANTLMFVFLASVMNYDNLVAFVSTLAVLLLLKVGRKATVVNVLGLVALLVAAPLVKAALLPFSAVLGIATLYYAYKSWPSLLKQFKKPQNKYLHVFLIMLVVVFSGLFIERYVYNFATYGALEPECIDVYTYDQCIQNGIFEREQILKDVNFDRSIDKLSYAQIWLEKLKRSIYGILAHKTVQDTALVGFWGSAFLYVSLFATARKVRAKDIVSPLGVVVLAALFYVASLIVFNFGIYNSTGLHLGLQGRYFFPAMPVLTVVGLLFIGRLKVPNSLAVFAVSFTLLAFVTAGLPSYIYLTNPSWHTDATKEVNKDLQDALNTPKTLLKKVL